MLTRCRQNKNVLSFMLKICLTYCFLMIVTATTVFAQDTEIKTDASQTHTDGTKDCEPRDGDFKKMAEKANQELIDMKTNYDEYEKQLEAMRKNDVVCFVPNELDFKTGDKSTAAGKAGQALKALVNSSVDMAKVGFKYITAAGSAVINGAINGINKATGSEISAISGGNLTFDAKDEKGASIAASKYLPAIANSFAAVNGRLKDTQLDIASYKKDLTKAKTQYSNDKNSLRQDLASIADNKKRTEINGQIKVLDEKINILSDCLNTFENLLQPRKKMGKARENAHTYLQLISGLSDHDCTCNAKTGDLLTCTVKDDTFEEDDVNDATCKQLNEYQSDLSVCPTCGIFETILVADQDLAKGAFEKLSGGLIKVLITAFLIFLAYQVLMLVGSPAKQGIGKFMNTVLLQGFKVAVAVVLLEVPSFIYENGLTPIIESGFEFGLALIPTDAKNVVDSYAENYNSFNQENQLLTADFLKKLMGAVEGFNEKSSIIPAIGRSLYCNSWQNKVWYIIPHWEMMFEGILVFAFGLMIMLAVGFYLLDVAIHLGIICCVLPFLIACWPFKLTSGYTSVGWKMLMNVFFRFVMMGVLLATVVELLKEALTVGINENDLMEWLNSNDTDSLSKAMNITGLQMLILVICCMISMKLVRNLSGVTERFAPGGVPTGDMGAKLGGTAASAATIAAKAGMGKAGAVAGKAAGEIAEASGAKGAAQAAKNKIQGSMQKAAGAMGIGSKAKMAGGRNGGGSGGNGSSGGGSGSSGGQSSQSGGGSGGDSGNNGGSNSSGSSGDSGSGGAESAS